MLQIKKRYLTIRERQLGCYNYFFTIWERVYEDEEFGKKENERG